MRTAEGIFEKFYVGNETCVEAIQFSLKSYGNNDTLYVEICMCFCVHLKCTYTLDIHRNGTFFRQALQKKNVIYITSSKSSLYIMVSQKK